MRRLVAAGAVVAVAAGVGGVLMWQNSTGILPGDDPYCEARVGETVVRLDPDQAHNASLIAAVAVRRELPARAASIALAAA